MPKGVMQFSIVHAEYDNAEVEKFLAQAKYADHTKDCIRMVLIGKKGLREASEKHGVSRQLVYKRCREVLNKLGVELNREEQIKTKLAG